MSGFSRLSLNSATTKYWTLEQVIEGCVRTGIPAIGPWRDRVAEVGTERAAKLISNAGLRVSSLCRGGFLTASDREGREAAVRDNRAAILEGQIWRLFSYLFIPSGGNVLFFAISLYFYYFIGIFLFIR